MAKRILIWGSTRVGKTALLATALFSGAPELSVLSGKSEGGALYTRLFEAWLRLSRNQFVPATSVDENVIGFRISEQQQVELVDVRGRLATSLGVEQGARELLASADAVLFLAEYESPEQQIQMNAIQAAVVGHEKRPMAFALTKCEVRLRHEDPVWDAHPGWLRNTPFYRNHSRLLQYFHDSAWPTSAFGYAEPERLPAIILGEFGQSLPFRIQPRNVALPLAYLLGELGCL